MAKVSGILASTHPLEKYGGRFQASLSDLEELREVFLAGGMESTMQHDPLHAFDAEPVDACGVPKLTHWAVNWGFALGWVLQDEAACRVACCI